MIFHHHPFFFFMRAQFKYWTQIDTLGFPRETFSYAVLWHFSNEITSKICTHFYQTTMGQKIYRTLNKFVSLWLIIGLCSFFPDRHIFSQPTKTSLCSRKSSLHDERKATLKVSFHHSRLDDNVSKGNFHVDLHRAEREKFMCSLRFFHANEAIKRFFNKQRLLDIFKE